MVCHHPSLAATQARAVLPSARRPSTTAIPKYRKFDMTGRLKLPIP